MILESDKLSTAFEIRATKTDLIMMDGGVQPNAYLLTILHDCKASTPGYPDGGLTEIDISWVRCPWCSKQVPERIRRIFRKK